MTLYICASMPESQPVKIISSKEFDANEIDDSTINTEVESVRVKNGWSYAFIYKKYIFEGNWYVHIRFAGNKTS